jgi:group I intron endonuclease
MGCGIYRILNLIDEKIYIGSSVDINSREYKHFWMLDKNVHDNQHLQNSYNKMGKINFQFKIIEECDEKNLIQRENYYINFYKSNNSEYGYNMASVNEFRRNTYNDEVKMKLSKHNMTKNGNFNKFSLENIETGEERVFETLVEGANYLLMNGFANGNLRNIRMKLSSSLRGVKLNNGKNNNGSIRKTCYKHKFKIIN